MVCEKEQKCDKAVYTKISLDDCFLSGYVNCIGRILRYRYGLIVYKTNTLSSGQILMNVAHPKLLPHIKIQLSHNSCNPHAYRQLRRLFHISNKSRTIHGQYVHIYIYIYTNHSHPHSGMCGYSTDPERDYRGC